MDNILHEPGIIQKLINSEMGWYREAIRNKRFEDVEEIYLKIKDLQKAADTLMRKANKYKKVEVQ